MRTIGIDLAILAAHKAVVADEQGRYVTPVLKFHTRSTELDNLVRRARDGATTDAVQAVMEPTGMAWFPVAVYLVRHGVTPYVVSSQQVADLRRFYKRHAKSDRIDARVLARLPLVNPDKLYPLRLPTANALACQRGCKQLERWMGQMTATHNRLLALDRFAWPGLEVVFADPFAPVTRWFRRSWYDPHRIVANGAETLSQQWQASGLDGADAAEWAPSLVRLAAEVVALYGDATYLDYALLQAEVDREQAYLETLEAWHHTLRIKTVRPLYRQIHPSRVLETLYGVGQDGAAVNYVLGFFPSVPVNVRNFMTGLFVAVLTAAVVYVSAQLSPAQLNLTLLQVWTAVVGFLVSFAGSLFGLVKGKQVRAAAVASRLLDA